MQDIVGWSSKFKPGSKPWLMLGKGPTFQKVRDIDTSRFYVCSLNHAVRELPVTLAHVIDIEVVADCADEIYRNAKFLAIPYRPHFKNHPSSKTLVDLTTEIPILRQMEREGRLVWYNLSSSAPHADSPVVNAVYFSSEAALNLLVIGGVGEVRTLGVDGGRNYSEAFEDLRATTLLANGHETFDKQFSGICNTIRKSGVFYAPLFIDAPIRIFVGADAAQTLGVRMLEYSIKRHTPVSVDVVRIDDTNVPIPKDPTNRSRSGFSFCRFDIPRRCNYHGRAIYMDADMQVFADVTPLWNCDMQGAGVLYCDPGSESKRLPQYSVMLMDCSVLPWDVAEIVRGLDEGQYSYEQLMHELIVLPERQKRMALPFEWNSLEHYEASRTCLIHYTDMPTQPWVSKNNPNGHLWHRLLKEAITENFITMDELRREIRMGHVSPELTKWADLPDIADAAGLSAHWVPPYQRFLKLRSTRWVDRIRRMLSPR